jgi:hypothetical protein
MLLKVREEGQGLHPNEVVVSVQTKDGAERLVVHKRALCAGALEIGYPILVDDDQYLVELPRETMRGLWRVWVKKSAVVRERETV